MKENQHMIDWINNLGYWLLHGVLPAALLFAAGSLLIRFGVKIITRIFEKSNMEPIAYKLILKVLKAAAYTLLGLMVASKLGIDVSGTSPGDRGFLPARRQEHHSFRPFPDENANQVPPCLYTRFSLLGNKYGFVSCFV